MTGLFRHWPWTALVLALVVLAYAHGVETFGRLAPCELCLKERQIWWAAAAVGLAGGVVALRSPRARLWTDALLALVFLGGFLLAGYHAGVEWGWWTGPEACTGAHVRVNVADMERLLNGGAMSIPRCDRPAFVFLGLSMAGWDAVACAGAGLASLWALTVTWRRAEF